VRGSYTGKKKKNKKGGGGIFFDVRNFAIDRFWFIGIISPILNFPFLNSIFRRLNYILKNK
jgi:hypothetical protein